MELCVGSGEMECKKADDIACFVNQNQVKIKKWDYCRGESKKA